MLKPSARWRIPVSRKASHNRAPLLEMTGSPFSFSIASIPLERLIPAQLKTMAAQPLVSV
jgi:hypothetical protein